MIEPLPQAKRCRHAGALRSTAGSVRGRGCLGGPPQGLPPVGEVPFDERALVIGQMDPQEFLVALDVRLVRPLQDARQIRSRRSPSNLNLPKR